MKIQFTVSVVHVETICLLGLGEGGTVHMRLFVSQGFMSYAYRFITIL